MTAVVKNNQININPKLSIHAFVDTSGDDTHYIYTDPRYLTAINAPVSATAVFSVAVTTDTQKSDGTKFDIEDANVNWDEVKASSVDKYIGEGSRTITGVRFISDQATNTVPYSVTQIN